MPRTRRSARVPMPWAGLSALSVAGFVTLLTEAVPAGLLPQLSDGLGVSRAMAGQLVTVYAAGSMLAAIPLTALTRRRPRRPVLLATIAAVAAANALTACSPWFALTFAGRLVAGLGAGLQWAMLAGYAMRLVPAPARGRALAVAMAGVPVALAFGVPAGTFLGTALGWRAAFAVMAALGVAVAVWVRCCVPALDGEAAGRSLPVRRVLALPGVAAILVAGFAFEVGHTNLYTYIAPFLGRSGLQERVGVVLLAFGIASILGLWITGTLIDRRLRTVVVAVFAALAAVMIVLAAAGTRPGVVLAATAVWGLALGGAPTVLQAASARAAGESVEITQSLLVTMLNAGMAAGPLLGGGLVAAAGVAPLPWASAAVLTGVLVVAVLARRHAFPATVPPVSAPAPTASGSADGAAARSEPPSTGR
ncbi:MFS transporter [Actinomadura kijaniata]|uniref:MFS transporter n=1 Tax=Actinomadura kijaniata TaxID=46161 RepID=UPI0009FB98AA|nr:MFS transporter [Actinomadura kijaniata]